MIIECVENFTRALEIGPYAWPGGYPTYFIMADGEALSFESADDVENAGLIREAIRDHNDPRWRAVAFEINWEDPNLYCCHTGKPIPSAYC